MIEQLQHLLPKSGNEFTDYMDQKTSSSSGSKINRSVRQNSLLGFSTVLPLSVGVLEAGKHGNILLSE